MKILGSSADNGGNFKVFPSQDIPFTLNGDLQNTQPATLIILSICDSRLKHFSINNLNLSETFSTKDMMFSSVITIVLIFFERISL